MVSDFFNLFFIYHIMQYGCKISTLVAESSSSVLGLQTNRSSREEPLDEKPERTSSPDRVHHLYGHGVCKWPGCETVCEDLQAFVK